MFSRVDEALSVKQAVYLSAPTGYQQDHYSHERRLQEVVSDPNVLPSSGVLPYPFGSLYTGL